VSGLESLADAGLLPALVGVIGLLVGSFLNVVIFRLPKMMERQWEAEAAEWAAQGATPPAPQPAAAESFNLLVPRSRCQACGHMVRWYENIPVLSWLALRGRCSACKTPISVQYPIVELVTGLAFAACVWRFGVGLEALAAIVFTGLLISLSGIDWRTQYLPDDLTYPLLWLGLGASVMTLFVPAHSAILGALVGYLSLWTVSTAYALVKGRQGMGNGDFKLLAALGAGCGVSAILPIVLLSSLVGAIIGGLGLALQGRDRATPIPFGPFLAIAGWIWFLFGSELMALYWGLMLPAAG